MEKFIKKLGIKKIGHYEGNTYIIEFEDSDEYSRAYTVLDSSNLVDLDEETVLVSENSSMLTYYATNYECTLIGNFDKDVYRLNVKEI